MGARDIVTNLIANDRASKPIKEVGRSAKESADKLERLSVAERRLALEVEKAQVRVEKATKSATNAEERYGRESLQAREATTRLKAAVLDLADAEEKLAHKADNAGDALSRTKRKAREAGEAEDGLKRKTREAGQEAEKTDKKTSGLTSRLGMLGAVARHASGLSVLQLGTKGLGSALATAVPAVAAVIPKVALFGSVAVSSAMGAVTLATKVGGLVVQLGHVAAAVGPAAASLPGLAAGFLFAKGTITLASAGIVKGLKPITDAIMGTPGKVNGKAGMIGGLQAQLQDIAGRGLPQLSRQFLKVNFPTVADAMTRIAKSTNSVVLAVGKWANTINGQRAIRAVTEGTATAVERLAPHVSKLAESFGNLVARAGPSIFERVATGLGRAANAAGRFLDSISKSDINQAWMQLDRYAGAVESFAKRVPAWGHAIMDGVRWWQAHADQIRRVRDILSVVALAVGVATGGWLPALGAAVSLLVSHWRDVISVMDRVQSWFHGTSDAATRVRGVVDGLRSGVSDLVSWFRGQLLPALERAARAVMPAVHDAIRMVTDAFRNNRDVIDKARGVLTALGVVVTEAIIPAVTFLAQQAIHLLGAEFSGLIYIVNKVVLPGIRIFSHVILDVIGAIIHGAADVADAFGLPIAGRLKEAAGKFDKFRNQVNSALGGINDQTVNVGVKITPAQQVKSQLAAFGHAAGGYITGPGGPRDDAVPAMLSNGEFVVNAAATSRNRGLLEAINGRGYAHGGIVLNEQLTGLRSAQLAEVALVRKMAASMPVFTGGGGGGRRPGGISDAEWYIISRESGGRTTAANPTSTAFGLGQLLIGNRQHYGAMFGVSPNTTDFGAQLAMFRAYVRDRYGTAENAAAFWAAHHWYDQGGLAKGPGLIAKGPKPERILSPAQTVRFERAMTAASGPQTVRLEVNVTAGGGNIALENQVMGVIKGAVKRALLSPTVLPPGTRP